MPKVSLSKNWSFNSRPCEGATSLSCFSHLPKKRFNSRPCEGATFFQKPPVETEVLFQFTPL